MTLALTPRPVTQARWTTRVSSSPARTNSATGSDSFGLCATSIEPGPQMTQSSPSRLSQPPSVPNDALPHPVCPSSFASRRTIGVFSAVIIGGVSPSTANSKGTRDTASCTTARTRPVISSADIPGRSRTPRSSTQSAGTTLTGPPPATRATLRVT